MTSTIPARIHTTFAANGLTSPQISDESSVFSSEDSLSSAPLSSSSASSVSRHDASLQLQYQLTNHRSPPPTSPLQRPRKEGEEEALVLLSPSQNSVGGDDAVEMRSVVEDAGYVNSTLEVQEAKMDIDVSMMAGTETRGTDAGSNGSIDIGGEVVVVVAGTEATVTTVIEHSLDVVRSSPETLRGHHHQKQKTLVVKKLSNGKSTNRRGLKQAAAPITFRPNFDRNKKSREEMFRELDREEKKVNDGTHPLFLKRLQARKTAHNHHKEHNDQLLKVTIEHFQRMHESETQAGKQWLSIKRSDTQKSMIEKLQSQLWQLEREWRIEQSEPSERSMYVRNEGNMTPPFVPDPIQVRERYKRLATVQILNSSGPMNRKYAYPRSRQHPTSSSGTETDAFSSANEQKLKLSEKGSKKRSKAREAMAGLLLPSKRRRSDEEQDGWLTKPDGSLDERRIWGSIRHPMTERPPEKKYAKCQLGSVRVSACSSMEADEDLALMGC